MSGEDIEIEENIQDTIKSMKNSFSQIEQGQKDLEKSLDKIIITLFIGFIVLNLTIILSIFLIIHI